MTTNVDDAVLAAVRDALEHLCPGGPVDVHRLIAVLNARHGWSDFKAYEALRRADARGVVVWDCERELVSLLRAVGVER